MKKFTLLFASVLVAGSMFAQTRTGSIVSTKEYSAGPKVVFLQNKAIGDTLMHFDGYNFFVTNPTDNAAFDLLNEDLDGLTSNNAGWTNYKFYYSVSPEDFMHNDVDTANYIASTSWFNPAGQADDWFSFGPITIPANGASITWAVKNNAGYRDGYKVHVSTAGMSNYNDFTNAPIYSRTDLVYGASDPTEAADTVYTYKTVDIPNTNNGLPVYIAFQHNANDMDVIYFDEVSIIEKNTASIDKNHSTSSINVFPNPVKDVLNINNMGNDAKITILNSLGQVVYSSVANNSTSISTENLNEGVYFVRVNSSVSKFVVKK